MNLREITLGVAIFILTLFVTTYGVNIFFSEPDYNDYCGSDLIKRDILNENQCLAAGGEWTTYVPYDGEIPGYCDLYSKCNAKWEEARHEHSQGVFLIALPLGILLILLGAYLFSLDAVGVGIMAGGVGTVLRGVTSYWQYTEDWFRFLISLVGLFIVILFAYRFREKLGLKESKNLKRKKKKK